MRQKEVTLEFLENGILENKQEDICLWEEIETELVRMIEDAQEELKDEGCDEDDSEELKEKIKSYQKALAEVREYKHDESAYSIYCNICDYYDEIIGELHEKSQKQQEERCRISELASNYLKIVRNMPDDTEFKIDFSAKSPSIYIKTNVDVTDESTEEFCQLGSSGFTVENVYEDYSCFEGNIEIRLSDHDFGGYTKFNGYGDYVSYKKACINIVYRL